MKPTPISLGAFTALFSLATLLPRVQEAPAPLPQEGGLRRVDPTREREEENADGLGDLFARNFDRDRWRERLGTADLEQRERHFDALLRRARLDPVARAFLEELERDPAAGELAWTARLALRELGKAAFPLQGLLPGGPLGTDPFGRDLLGMSQRMQQMMQELLSADGGWMFPPGSMPGAPAGKGGHGSGRRVHVEQDEHGALVRVTETVDGNESTRSYEGSSLEEILREHPELEQELEGLRIRVQPGSPLDLRFDLGGGLHEPLERRFPGQPGAGPLAPQELSRPVLTDRLGVIVRPIGRARARELALEERGLAGQGLVVERTYPETYAHLLGVGTGDVLIELDGVALSEAGDIERAMRARKPDQVLTLVWLDQLGQRREKSWQPSPAPKQH